MGIFLPELTLEFLKGILWSIRDEEAERELNHGVHRNTVCAHRLVTPISYFISDGGQVLPSSIGTLPLRLTL